ncbi:MAG: hypothetical protein A2V88_08300 [Elusimicrobia bacterium RBG_16_66_12]|nr:MAG: hypothetical protein A2V88_08300 [Elusimicrobia bacterium RBG_16_66_12]
MPPTDTATDADGSGPWVVMSRRVDRLELDVRAELGELKERIGQAPDPSTGRAGSGLSGVVAQLAERRSTVAASAAGAGGAVGVLWALIELLQRIGVL